MFERIGRYEQGTDVAALMGKDGFMAARRQASSAHKLRVNEAARLMAAVASGQEDPFILAQAMRPTHEFAVLHINEHYPRIFNPTGKALGLKETMSISDYQALYVDVLDRMYYGYYNAAPDVNAPLAKEHNLRDFRTVKRFMEDGVVQPLTIVKNGSAIPERALIDETPITYYPDLYAARTSVNWRAMVNDDLGIFNDLAQRLAIAGRRAIMKFRTGLYMDANGPNVNLYKAAFTNLITTTYGAASNNPPLSIQGLQDGFKVIAKMLDPTGDPIVFTGQLYLWFGPALVATAQNLMHMLTAQLSVNGGTANVQGFPTQFIEVNNWAVQNMNTIMDPYIPIVCTTAGIKDTSWGLTYDPRAQNRPSLEMGWLTGFKTPQLYQKVPNTMRVGGGVDPTLGDFRTMDQELKVVTVFGGTQIDGRSTVASNGSGV